MSTIYLFIFFFFPSSFGLFGLVYLDFPSIQLQYELQQEKQGAQYLYWATFHFLWHDWMRLARCYIGGG